MKAKMIRTIFLLLLFAGLAYLIPCDKVAMLPSDFADLIPEGERLQKIHLHQFFFLDEPTSSLSNPNSIKIDIRERSVFKVQVTPKMADLRMELKLNGQTINLETTADIPIDYTSLSLNSGTVQLDIFMISAEENRKELINASVGDLICNSAYMVFEIYLERVNIFEERRNLTIAKIDKIAEFNELEDIFLSTSKKDSYPIKTHLTSYKVPLNDLKAYSKAYNLSVVNEFDISIPDSKITNDTVTHEKVFLKFQIYADFFLFGSFHLLLIRISDIDTYLGSLNCLFDGKCILAEHPSKNAQILETLLTPGDYKILLVNLSTQSLAELSKSLPAVPISAKLKLKRFEKVDNVYNCEGRRLPKDFDYLMAAEDNAFEFKADLIPNLNKLFDSVDFSISEDSLLRVVTIYQSGNYIDIDLLRLTDTGAEELLVTTTHKSDEEDDSTSGLQHVLSLEVGDVDGLIRGLTKGKYRLRFNYAHSFFIETERRTCETFNIKIGISKVKYIEKFHEKLSVFNPCSSSFNKDKLDSLFRNLDNIVNNDSIYTTAYDSNDANKYIYSTMFEVNGSYNLNIQVLSDFVSSNVIPIIMPVEKRNTPLSDSLNNLSTNKIKLHDNKVSIKLSKGKYYFILVHGITQYNYKRGPNETWDSNKPQCVNFQIRMNAIKLSKKQQSWDCNTKEYDVLPDNLNTLDTLYGGKDKLTIFSKTFLIPETKKEIKIKTNSSNYIMRVVYQFDAENDNMEIAIAKDNKVLRTAKPNILDDELLTSQDYLNYNIKANSEYKLIVTRTGEADYFAKCRLFRLEISLVSFDR
jgi:hypothetical protein